MSGKAATRPQCSAPGCPNRIRSGGFCMTHLQELIARGDTPRDMRKAENRPRSEMTCRVDDCTTAAAYRGYKLCGAHYRRLKKHGTFELPAKPTPREVIQANTRVDENGCWIWTAAIATSGYGRTLQFYAHRVSHEAYTGPIPEGYQIDHLCRERRCVNPDHLEAVTQLENLRRQREAMTTRATTDERRSDDRVSASNQPGL